MLRGLAAKLDVGLRLQKAKLLQDSQDEAGDVVHAVAAVPLQPAQVDVGEVVVGPALLRRDPDLGRRRVIVELDPQAGDQLPGLLGREGPVLIPFS